MSIVDTSVNDPNRDALAKVALGMELVDTSHDMGRVHIFGDSRVGSTDDI
jgi:hypothetical protein